MFPGSALFRYYNRVSSPSSAGASSSHGKRTSEDGGIGSQSTMPIARLESSLLASTECTPPLLNKDNLHRVCNQPRKCKLPRSNMAVKLCKPHRDTTRDAVGIEIDRESVGDGHVVIQTDSETLDPIVISNSATKIALEGVVLEKKKYLMRQLASSKTLGRHAYLGQHCLEGLMIHMTLSSATFVAL